MATVPTHDGPPDGRTGRRTRDRGAGVVEYALLLTLIAIATLTATSFLGDQMSGSFDTSGESIAGG